MYFEFVQGVLPPETRLADELSVNSIDYDSTCYSTSFAVPPLATRDFSVSTCSSHSHMSAGNADDSHLNTDDLDEDDLSMSDHAYMVEYHVPTPKTSLTPVSITACNTIGCCESRRLLKVLFDSGTTKTLINRRAVPKNAKPVSISRRSFSTLAGHMDTSHMVKMRDVRLPEFNKNRSIDEQAALVFDNKDCKYDIIFGSDFLARAGLVLDYVSKEVEWFGDTIPLRDSHHLTTPEFNAMMDAVEFYSQQDDHFDEFGVDIHDSYASAEILDAKYDAMDVEEVIAKQTHLTDSQRSDLRQLLHKYYKVFDGKLGVYPHRQLHIDIDKDAEPISSRPYPVPMTQREAYKKELDHLVELGVLCSTPIGLESSVLHRP